MYTGTLLDTIRGGSKIYTDATDALDIVIAQYDQAVIDFTASIVAGGSTLL